MKYIGFVTKGLEKIAEKEIQLKIADAEIIEVGVKRIIFETDESFNVLLQLRTIDDICFYISQHTHIKSSEALLDIINQTDFQKSFDLLNEYRSLNNIFSLTLSLVGFAKKNDQDLTQQLSTIITEKYTWNFTERDHSNFDIRIFVDHEYVLVGVRLCKENLSHRVYKKSSKPGSLRPSIAAAMVQIATDGKNGTLVDTFCGSGTILCESLLSGNKIFGSDIDFESVEITKNNLKQINYNDNSPVLCQNALKTHFNENFFDFAVSNLPWDKQIKVESITDLYIGALREYKRILKKNGVLCVLVTKPELFIKHARYLLNPKKVTRIPISLLGQSPEIVLLKI